MEVTTLPPTPPSERIYLLHGTYSGEETGSEWWGPESTFSRMLAETLRDARQSLQIEIEKFRWGGDNSETVRRAMAARLLEELRSFERDAPSRAYHLVAHSHGGLVIWHALLRSVAEGQPLKNLKSWTTIGTPFLDYGPALRSIWLCVAALAAVVSLALFAYGNGDFFQTFLASARWSGQSLKLAALAAVLLGLLAIAVGGLAIVTGFLWTIAADPGLRRQRRKAYELYGSRHLCLYHPADEAILGLKVSMLRPGKILPRRKADAEEAQTEDSKLSDLLSRPIDQLAWQAVGRSLQGDDMRFEDLIGVGAGPLPGVSMRSGFAAADVTSHTNSTTAGAANLLDKFRATLADEARGERRSVDPKRLVGVIDWTGVLHTSYFDQSGTATRVAHHILGKRAGIEEMDAVAPDVPTRSRYTPWALLAACVGLSTATVIGLAGYLGFLAQDTISPYTRHYAIAESIDRSLDPALAAAQASDLPGHLFARRDLIGRLGAAPPADVKAFFERLTDPETSARSAQIYAHWLGSFSHGDVAKSVWEDFAAVYRSARSMGWETDVESGHVADIDIPLSAGRAFAELPNPNDQTIQGMVSNLASSLLPNKGAEIATDGTFLAPMTALYLSDIWNSASSRPQDLSNLLPACTDSRPVALALVEAGEIDRAVALESNCTPRLLLHETLATADWYAGLRVDVPLKTYLEDLKIQDANAQDATTKEACSEPDGPSTRCRLLDVANLLATGTPEALGKSDVLINRLDSADEAACPTVLAFADIWQRIAAQTNPTLAEQMGYRLQDCFNTTILDPPEHAPYHRATEAVIGNLVASDPAGSLDSIIVQAEAKYTGDSGNGLANAAYATLAASVHLARGEKQKATAAIESAVADLERQRLDRGEFALWILDMCLAVCDEEPLDRAFRAARDAIFVSQDPKTRGPQLARLATLEANRGDFPAAFRLADDAGNPTARLRVLIAVSDVLIDDLRKHVGTDYPALPPVDGVATEVPPKSGSS